MYSSMDVDRVPLERFDESFCDSAAAGKATVP